MAKQAQEGPKDCKQSTDVLVDLSNTFLKNYDHTVQNHSDTIVGHSCLKQEL